MGDVLTGRFNMSNNGPRKVDSGGEPPDDSRMLARIETLEKDVATVKTDVAVIRSNYATREDIHKEISAQTWKLVTFVCGFGTALVAAVYFIAKHTP
jgi:hypothetical protein